MILECERLCVRYLNGREALRDVSFVLDRGELVVIAGATGSGKSTLALRLANVIPQNIQGEVSGTVRIDGRDTSGWGIHEVSKRLQLLLQNPEAMLFAPSVEENIQFGPENLCFGRDEIFARTGEALVLMKLGAKRASGPDELSGGEEQRAALASMLAMDPEILILDEPFTNLDAAGKQDFARILEELKRKGKAIIVIEHRLSGIRDLADRVLVMEEGGLKSGGSAQVGCHSRESGNPESLKTLDPGSSLRYARDDKGLDPKSVIEVSHLSFTYENGCQALRDVSFDLRRGEFAALTGPNGSGKSTLAFCLAGLYPKGSGSIHISGEVGYVFQRPEVQLFCDSVFEELAFGLKNRKVPKTEINSRVREMAQRMHLDGILDRHPHTLSRGEMKRLAVASVAVLEPDVLILDEPTVGQDERSLAALMGEICDLNRKGITILMITHDLDLAREYASSFLEMEKGQVKVPLMRGVSPSILNAWSGDLRLRSKITR